ncbi:MAG: hypothetical protein B0D92_04275 [Spirochaeta sp. LUC14_002_19_P3]|nr:MAG: hypothetical protein B0D92_04275 [Spirochaeta sp. LUC14_002_19_P3]
MVGMFGKDRGKGKQNFEWPEYKRLAEELTKRYQVLTADYELDAKFIESFNKRLVSAKYGGRNPEEFFEEELKECHNLEKMIHQKHRDNQMKEDALQRYRDRDTFADKIINDIQSRIENYKAINLHPEADREVVKLYGAMAYFDTHYWDVVETYLRRAFPQPGQLDRMSIEQRFWRFVSSRDDRPPNALEQYKRILETPGTLNGEKAQEVREAVKVLAFFLHELLEVCEKAAQLYGSDARVEEAVQYIKTIIEDFRLKHLKRLKP